MISSNLEVTRVTAELWVCCPCVNFPLCSHFRWKAAPGSVKVSQESKHPPIKPSWFFSGRIRLFQKYRNPSFLILFAWQWMIDDGWWWIVSIFFANNGNERSSTILLDLAPSLFSHSSRCDVAPPTPPVTGCWRLRGCGAVEQILSGTIFSRNTCFSNRHLKGDPSCRGEAVETPYFFSRNQALVER